MQLFEMLSDSLKYLDQEKIEQVHQAYILAEKAHAGQYRASGEPYIVHPVAVARILANMNMDHQTIVAAILHDVIEDTAYTKEDIRRCFDNEIADLVDGVTKLTKIKFNSKAEAQAENFRKMLLAMTKDIRTIIIKLADRMHNMQTVQHLDYDRRRRISRETLEIFAPLARRVGMHSFSLRLENLGFSVLHPLRYRVLADAMKKVQGSHYDILESIKDDLKEALKKYDISLQMIEAREKHLYSVYRKMKIKRVSFSDITDFYAFRIIVDSIDDCYRTMGVVHSIYKPLPEKFKDYIALPKNNGYQSLHTIMFGPYGVPIEVQIRTPKMNSLANNGIASHWVYKSGEKPDQIQIKAHHWLESLLEIQQRSGNSIEFIENVKIDLFPDDVYVFTPEGDIMELPAGATAMDFAYMVHTDVGNHGVAARIDRQLAPLSTILTNGQTVEIISTSGASPSAAWLNVVVTGKAKSAIRHYLKNRRIAESEELGLMLLKRSFSNSGIDFDSCSEESLTKLHKELNFDSLSDLLVDVGLGNRAAPLVCRYYRGLQDISTGVSKVENKPLTISGAEGMVIKYPSCCYPIPGDLIIGILDAGEGIVIHSEQCNMLSRYAEKDLIPVSWAENISGDFKVCVQVQAVNKRGILVNLAMAISDSKSNIEDINVVANDQNYSVINFIIIVNGRQQLARILKSLRNIKEVNKVIRYRKNIKNVVNTQDNDYT